MTRIKACRGLRPGTDKVRLNGLLRAITMAGTTPNVWIATYDGRDMIRADAIVVIRMDGDRVTAQLHDEARVSVSLVDGTNGPHPPADFHRRLVKIIAELAEASGGQLVQAVCDDHTWHWSVEAI